MQLTLRNLFLEMGHDFNNMQLDVPIEVSGWEIESYDFNKKQNCWKDIKHIVRKESTKTYELINVETNEVIVQVSPLHKFWVKLDQTCDFAWIEAVELTNFDSFIVKSQDREVSCRIELNEDIIEIADIEVEGTHCYYSNGILSHNTLYGDPTTTPGGEMLASLARV